MAVAVLEGIAPHGLALRHEGVYTPGEWGTLLPCGHRASA
jgi:hypothetical protein